MALDALGVHALLVVAIAFSVSWRTSNPAGVEAELWAAVPQIAAHPGPVYMRLLRGQVPLVLDEIEGYRFELGKAKMLREGKHPREVAAAIGVSARNAASPPSRRGAC